MDELKKVTSAMPEARPDEGFSDICENNTGGLSLEWASFAPSTPGANSSLPETAAGGVEAAPAERISAAEEVTG